MKNHCIEAAILALGLLLLGLFVKQGLTNLAQKDRHVSVRGLAEREVQADRVTWPITYKCVGSNLVTLYADVNRANAAIKAYLVQNGIPPKEISVGAPQVVDRWADQYGSERPSDRYNLTCVTTVTSHSVERVRGLIMRTGELLKQGIAVSVGDWQNQVQYEFTGLNKIKPQMIEEATHNARQAAKKFAKDSGSKLGKIESASQGLFSVDDRDAYSPHIKRVRVVTQIDYYLDN